MIEIERKFLPKPDVPIDDVFVNKIEIYDYYLNSLTRVRKANNIWSITAKGEGTIIRSEYEFKLDLSPEIIINLIDVPAIIKTRKIIPFKQHNFEVNYFKNIFFNDNPLILIEVELQEEGEYFEKPMWLGEEVTHKKQFYGWNLFQSLQNDVQ